MVMEEAYRTTINDLEIAISNCSWVNFERINELTLELQKYKKLLKELENGNK
jgi:hypothetical protein